MKIDRSVAQLASRLQPRSNFPQTTKFGSRMVTNELEKRLAASYIALECIKTGHELFVADGSSGLWVFVAILELDLQVRVNTNSAAIVAEKLQWPNSNAEVVVAPGTINMEYAGIYGQDAVDFCHYAALNAQLSIMPVTALTFDVGPSAGDPDACRIKRVVVPVAPELYLLSDSSKIGDGTTAQVFSGDHKYLWHEIRDTHDIRLVTDEPNDKSGNYVIELAKFRRTSNWTVITLRANPDSGSI